ncbi:integrase core domain-containing protein, partial [Xanthomonas phaseoli]|uniref:integrase core domain-containing protein n=1 Tax=Xanthomonas phaseoli TaxID=1985254 RepID=UPI002153098F
RSSSRGDFLSGNPNHGYTKFCTRSARTEIERWRREYNEERPKKAIGGMTPSAYAQQLANAAIINPGL